MYFALFVAVRMVYGLPYGMASRNFALCALIIVFLHTSLGKSRIYRFGKVSISVMRRFLRETEKKRENRLEELREEAKVTSF